MGFSFGDPHKRSPCCLPVQRTFRFMFLLFNKGSFRGENDAQGTDRQPDLTFPQHFWRINQKCEERFSPSVHLTGQGVCVCMCGHTRIHTYTCMCVCMYDLFTCVWMCGCMMYLHVHVCVCASACVCVREYQWPTWKPSSSQDKQEGFRSSSVLLCDHDM